MQHIDAKPFDPQPPGNVIAMKATGDMLVVITTEGNYISRGEGTPWVEIGLN